MLEQLEALEAKMAQLLERYRMTREENVQLRQRVLAMENANRQLSERLTTATARVETLFDRLP